MALNVVSFFVANGGRCTQVSKHLAHLCTLVGNRDVCVHWLILWGVLNLVKGRILCFCIWLIITALTIGFYVRGGFCWTRLGCNGVSFRWNVNRKQTASGRVSEKMSLIKMNQGRIGPHLNPKDGCRNVTGVFVVWGIKPFGISV